MLTFKIVNKSDGKQIGSVECRSPALAKKTVMARYPELGDVKIILILDGSGQEYRQWIWSGKEWVESFEVLWIERKSALSA